MMIMVVVIVSIIIIGFVMVSSNISIKLVPVLTNILFFPPLNIIVVFGSLVLVSEDIINRVIDKVFYIVNGLLKNVPMIVLLSFLFINMGGTVSLISIKAFVSVSMIVGNIIDVYLFGLIAVLMN